MTQAELLGGHCDPDIYNQRGNILHRLKQFRRACADFLYYTTQEPGSSVGWNYLGLCYIQLGDVRYVGHHHHSPTNT